MIRLSHLVSFVLALNGQRIPEAAVNTGRRVLVERRAKPCASVITTWGLQPPPATSLAGDSVSFRLLTWSALTNTGE